VGEHCYYTKHEIGVVDLRTFPEDSHNGFGCNSIPPEFRMVRGILRDSSVAVSYTFHPYWSSDLAGTRNTPNKNK
jgi:hypothetical protein